MLSIGSMASGQENYYIGLAREDYYLEGGEPPGRWVGQGADRLGLPTQVDPTALRNLFAGFTPDGKKSLVQNAGDTTTERARKTGWDLTFSAPKSVSVIWSQADRNVRAEIQAAQQDAVEKTLAFLEANGAITRRGKDGTVLEPCKLIMGTFEHGTSRAQDPQLHTHCLILNIGFREDGTTGALASKSFYELKMLLGAHYRTELSHQLERRLGLGSHQVKTWFELDGVKPSLVDFFSKRRQEIETILEQKGRSSAAASAVAAIESRTAKEHRPRSELFAEWRAVGREHGFSEAQVQALMEQGRAPRDPVQEKAEAMEKAIEAVSREKSHFTRNDFQRAALENMQGRGVSAAETLLAAGEVLAGHPEIVRLGEILGRERFTTRETMRIEKELFSVVEATRDQWVLPVKPETVDSVVKAFEQTKGFRLSEEQADAVKHLTTAKGQVQVVTGMAGTGKTTMLEAARQAWEAEGYQVIGATLSNRAARVLETETGIPTQSISRRIWEIEKSMEPKAPDQPTIKNPLGRKTILVVDEAGMVDTRKMATLITAVHESGGAVKLIGDSRQLQPIEAGAPLAGIRDIMGDRKLTEIRRQNEDWARQAVKDVADGHAHRALGEFAKRGLLRVGETLDQAKRALLEDWQKAGGCQAPEKNVIIANENVQVTDLNRRAQAARLAAGNLKGPASELGSTRFYQGDRVLFTKNKKVLGVDNGDTGTVLNTHGGSSLLRVRLDRGSMVTIDLSSYEHVRLGYAATVHKSQGSTHHNAYVLTGGGMQNREVSYVQLSRAKVETRIYADEAHVGPDVAEVARSTLAREMERSRQKDTVHELLNRIGGNDLVQDRSFDR